MRMSIEFLLQVLKQKNAHVFFVLGGTYFKVSSYKMGGGL